MKTILVVLVIAVVLGMIVLVRRRSPSPVGEILPADQMQKKYGLYAENRPNIEIDPDKVPAHLRDLIPMAEKWGVGDDIIRSDLEDKATEEEKSEFREALRGRTADVTAWLDSFDTVPDLKSEAANPMSEEAVPFMYMLGALDESGLWPD